MRTIKKGSTVLKEHQYRTRSSTEGASTILNVDQYRTSTGQSKEWLKKTNTEILRKTKYHRRMDL
jgi:hypothetical protein